MKIKNENLVVAILSASIVANAFMAGIVLSGPSMHNRPPFMMKEDPGMMRDIKVLSVEHRGAVEKIIKEHHKNIRNDMAEIRNTFDKVAEILTAPKFDEAKLFEIKKNMEGRDGKIKDNMSDMIIKIAKTLPDDQRIKFFENVMKHRGFFMDKRMRPGDEPNMRHGDEMIEENMDMMPPRP